MDLGFIVGLLLVITLLGVLAYILKELLSTTRIDFSKVNLSDALARQRNTEPAPINAHLIGLEGEVVRLRDEAERPLTVRLGSERWAARPDTAASRARGGESLSVGARVVVTAVEGPIVLVAPAGESTASSP